VEETMILWIIKNKEGKNVKPRQQERSENRNTIRNMNGLVQQY
jgi:hypothetical protein